MKKLYSHCEIEPKYSLHSPLFIFLFLLFAFPGFGQFQTPLETSSINGDNGFKMSGKEYLDWAGRIVSSAGDINGDGYDDILVGAPRADPDNLDLDVNDGAVYLIFGKSGNLMQDLDLGNLGSSGFTIRGPVSESEEFFGFVITSADINGDTYSDMILGGPFSEAYVIFGKPSGWSSQFDLLSLDGTNGTVISEGGADVGSIENVGDINNDGIDDIITGAGYVIYGKNSPYPALIDPSLVVFNGLTNGFKLIGLPGNQERVVDGVGDVNGDLIDDMIVITTSSSTSVTEAFVVFGGQSFTGSFDVSSVDGTSGFKIEGFTPFSNKQMAVGKIGDINNDGIDDIAIGDYYSETATNTGSTYVLFGKNSFSAIEDISQLDGSNGFELVGDVDDRSGSAIDGAGDFNNDGIDDMVIGAFGGSKAFIVYGSVNFLSAQLDLTTLDGSSGFVFERGSGRNFGLSVSYGGDINNDGIDDLIIGANLDKNVNSETSGAAYVLYGRAKVTNCAVPTDLAVTEINPYQVTVSWNDVNPGEKYEVEYKPTISGVSPTTITVVENNSVDIDITPAQQYKFRIRGVCTIGGNLIETAYTDYVYFTNTSGCIIPDGLAIADLDGNLGPDISNEEVTLTWNDVNIGQDYVISYKPSIAGVPFTDVNVIGKNFMTIQNLVVGQKYKVLVKAVCLLGSDVVTTDFSPVFYFTTTASGCEMPTLLFADNIDNISATIHWTNSSPGGSKSEILFKQAISGVSFQLYTAAVGVSSLDENDFGTLDPGTRYKYKVRSKCTISGKTVYSEYSNLFVFKTTSSGCGAPTGLDAPAVSAQSATVSWTSTGDNYIVQYKPTISGFGKQTVLVLTDNFVDLSSLITNQRYKFRVLSVCDLGGGTNVISSYSPWSYFTTNPLPAARTSTNSAKTTVDSEASEQEEKLSLSFDEALTIYPVPTLNFLNVHFNPASSQVFDGLLSVISIVGREVVRKEFKQSVSTAVDMSGEKRGVYFVKIVYGDKIYTQRFVLTD